MQQTNYKSKKNIAKTTGKTIKKVKTDFDRRVFFSPTAAKKYSIIDKIVVPSK